MLFSTTILTGLLSLAVAAPTKPGYVNIPLTHPISGVKNGSEVSNEEFVARLGYNFVEKNVRKYSSELFAAGIVQNSSYALSLVPANSSLTSEITFGGVNTGRYEGDLKEIFGQADPDQFVFRAGGNVNGAPFSNSSLWFVDAGKTLTYLNPATYEVVFGALLHNAGIRLSSQDTLATYPCADGAKATFRWTTPSSAIELTLADFGIPLNDVLNNGDKENCFVGIASSTFNNLGDSNVLGSNFLNNFYSVFDLKKNTLNLAKPAHKPDHYQAGFVASFE